MQKEKTSKLSALIALLGLLLMLGHTARAEESAAPDEPVLDQDATLGDMVKRAKEVGQREFVNKLNPPKKAAVANAAGAVEAAPAKAPVLLALYGTDRNYKAELDVDGQSRVVPVPGPLYRMGPWKYIALMEEGVLLSKTPVDNGTVATASAARRNAAGAAAGVARVRGQSLPCVQKETCLFLSVPKGANDSRSLTASDAQARLLAAQMPGAGRGPALEFGGKPGTPGATLNPGYPAPVPR